MKEQREMHACGRAQRRYLHWVWEKWDAYLIPNDLHTDAQDTERQQETSCAAMTLKARFTQEQVTLVTNAYSLTLVCIAVWSLAGFQPDLARLWCRSDSLSTGSLAPCDPPVTWLFKSLQISNALCRAGSRLEDRLQVGSTAFRS